MDYKEKLKASRDRVSGAPKDTFDEEMESDRGRSINSAAVRRLQQKTQVFPLETNAAVRSRLTHSLEVQQVGRYIAKLILKKLGEDRLNEFNLADKKEGFVSAIEIACLLHDVGNPPFGHFGEEAINHWAKSTLLPIFDEKFGDNIEDDIRVKDLMKFEGNAQAIRLLHSLQKLNLSYTQIACLLKYTRAAHEPKPENGDRFNYRKKKPGFYFSESEFVEKLRSELNINDGCRFPLTYVMEAADDISYCIADLDDALDKRILTVDQLHEAISTTWDKLKIGKLPEDDIEGNRYLTDVINSGYERYKKEPHNKSHAYILTLRTTLVNDLANYASDRFIDNHESVFNGTLDESLLDGSDKFYLATKTLKKVASSHVFSNKEVERLELKGHAVISGLLNIYTPLLKLSFSDFKKLMQTNMLKPYPIETRLFHDLPQKHKHTFEEAVIVLYERDTVSSEDETTELYYRARLIIDYVSGMTDRFALDEYRDLSATA
ncbi:MAG: dGTPase [Flavobacteriaceae bacterium]|nr:dGTPase [Flavobacteriaceae bacterium]